MNRLDIKSRLSLSVFGSYISSILNFLLNLLLIRIFSAEIYGLYSYIVSQSRGALKFLDFSFVELILISKKRNLKEKEIFETFIIHSFIRFMIVFLLGYLAAVYTDNLKTLSVIFFLLFYVNKKYFYGVGIVNFYEVFTSTKVAQFFYVSLSFLPLLTALIFNYFFDPTLFNIALGLFLSAVITMLLVPIVYFIKHGFNYPKIYFNVIKALRSHAVFLQIPIFLSLIIKFLQETLIIVVQDVEIFALYSISALIGSIAVITARGIIRPLAPYLWEKDKLAIKPFVLIGISVYSLAIFLSLLGPFFERIFLVWNDDYAGVSIFFSLGIIIAVSRAYSQIITVFLQGAGLLKNAAIVNSFAIAFLFLMIVFIYNFTDLSNFAINVLIAETIMINTALLIHIFIYVTKKKFIKE
tara:strand:+ start:4174 stop:5406 length:1233 start_codon:yes stop_codon:yes gene_type:complete